MASNRFLDTETDPNLLSPLTLAFIGDCVYELFIREFLVTQANRPTHELHARKVKFVNASAQAEAYKSIEPILTEKEVSIYKRGRNAHTNHTPKNMSSSDYHAATGFEALFGFLYLEGKIDRLRELFTVILKDGEMDDRLKDEII